MDRYFTDSYDPRLDVAPVPKTGHVGEEYERMLDVMREKERAKDDARRQAKRVRSPPPRPACTSSPSCRPTVRR